MRKIFFSLMLFLTINAGAQEFKLTKDGVEPIVINFEGYSADSLYKKSLAWANQYYKNPDKVVKENTADRIRIDAIKDNAFSYKSLGMPYSYDIEYSFTMEFKDGKLRATYSPGQIWTEGKRAMFNCSNFFKDDGTERSQYKGSVEKMDATMNQLASDLTNYIKSKKADW